MDLYETGVFLEIPHILSVRSFEFIQTKHTGRWGVFGQRMIFYLDKCRRVIRATAKVHDFMVGCRGEESGSDYTKFNTTAYKDLGAYSRKKGHPNGRHPTSNKSKLVEKLAFGMSYNKHKKKEIYCRRNFSLYKSNLVSN